MGMGSDRLYIYGLAVVSSCALAAWLLLVGVSFAPAALGAAAVLALSCAVARRFPHSFGRARVEITDVPAIAGLMLLGPVWTIAVLAPDMFYRDRLRTLFVSSGDILKLLVGGFVFSLFAQPLLFSPNALDASFVYGAVAGFVSLYAVDALVNSGLMRLKYGDPLLETVKSAILPAVPSSCVAILSALGVAATLAVYGPVAALVLFCGGAAAFASHALYHDWRRKVEALEADNAQLRIEAASILESPLVFAARLVEALGEKDGRTHRHAAAVSVYAGDIAERFGLEPEKVGKLRVAALVQDVGLVSLPDDVLLAPTEKLNAVGKAQLERHSVHGERMLEKVPGFEGAAKWVRWHTERIDGTGYPDRLRGEWQPLEARILAAVSVYADAVLDGHRNPALSPHDARLSMSAEAGRTLDENVVRTFLRVLDDEDANYATAADDRFAFPSLSSGNVLGKSASRPRRAEDDRGAIG